MWGYSHLCNDCNARYWCSVSCSSLIKNTSTKPYMWSTCLFTTITSQEKLKRLQSWRQDSAVQPHTAVQSVMEMSSCPAMLVPAPRGRTRPRGFPGRNAWEWLQQAELPFAPHLRVEWAREQQEQRGCLVTKREEGESLRWEPDVHLQLHQQQPMFFCTAAPAKPGAPDAKSHCRWWQEGERLERVAGHKSQQLSLGTSYKTMQPPHQGCQPVGCQQRRPFHAWIFFFKLCFFSF